MQQCYTKRRSHEKACAGGEFWDVIFTLTQDLMTARNQLVRLMKEVKPGGARLKGGDYGRWSPLQPIHRNYTPPATRAGSNLPRNCHRNPPPGHLTRVQQYPHSKNPSPERRRPRLCWPVSVSGANAFGRRQPSPRPPRGAPEFGCGKPQKRASWSFGQPQPERARYSCYEKPQPERAQYSCYEKPQPEGAQYSCYEKPQPERAQYSCYEKPQPEGAQCSCYEKPQPEGAQYSCYEKPQPAVYSCERDFNCIKICINRHPRPRYRRTCSDTCRDGGFGLHGGGKRPGCLGTQFATLLQDVTCQLRERRLNAAAVDAELSRRTLCS